MQVHVLVFHPFLVLIRGSGQVTLEEGKGLVIGTCEPSAVLIDLKRSKSPGRLSF